MEKLGFSNEWDERYQANTHMSIWPWSELVSYVMRFARPQEVSKCNVLELGIGAGANVPFFQWLGVNYKAIDGSATIIQELKKRFPDLEENLKVGDFTKNIPFDGFFDIIIDRASLTHNDTESIINCLNILHDKMKPGARFIGIDWFSTNHSDYSCGKTSQDKYTRSDIKKGTFKGTGKVHFSDENHIRELFTGFEITILEEKKIQRTIPMDNNLFASWNFVAIKKQ